MEICGLFIEPRKLKQIYYNIDNFYKIFPNSKLYFYCGKDLKLNYNNLKLKYKNLIINELSVNNLTPATYSDFLKDIKLWNNLDGDYCIIIQTDGYLCINSIYSYKYFINYDYVGCGNKTFNKFKTNLNGGFSIRKIKSMKNILKTIPPLKTKNKVTIYEKYFDINYIKYSPEDVYFYYGCKILNFKVYNENNFGLHEYNNFKNYYNTFCIHKLSYKYFNYKQINYIFNKYPEYKYFLQPLEENNEKIITNEELKLMEYNFYKKKIIYQLKFFFAFQLLFLIINYLF